MNDLHIVARAAGARPHRCASVGVLLRQHASSATPRGRTPGAPRDSERRSRTGPGLALLAFGLAAAAAPAGGQETPASAALQAVLEAGRRHCVGVRIRLHPPGPFPDPRLAPYYLPPLSEDRVAAARREGRPLRLPGVDLGKAGVFAPDPGLPPEAIAEAWVVGWDGRETAAEVALLGDAPGIVLRVADPGEGPAGEALPLLKPGDILWAVVARPRAEGRELPITGPLIVSDLGGPLGVTVPPGSLVCDGAGKPIGVAVGPAVREGMPWTLRDLAEATCVEATEFVRDRRGVEPPPTPLGRVRLRLRPLAPGAPEEMVVANAVLFPGGRPLVVAPMIEETVRRVAGASVFWAGSPGGSRTEVLGRVRGFAALQFGMGAGGRKAPPGYPADWRPDPLPRAGGIAYAVLPLNPGTVAPWEAGTRRAPWDVVFRLVSRPDGVVPDRPLPAGTLILSERGLGIPAGAVVCATVPRGAGGNDLPGDLDQAFVPRVVSFEEMGLAGEPKLDTRVRPLSAEDAVRRVWLGVEWQPLGPALARLLGVEAPTLAGKEGLLVSDVYPGSPAEKLGIGPGAVLLRIRDIERECVYGLDPDRLPVPPPSPRASAGDWQPDVGPGTRRNPLTALLTRIGAGPRMELAWVPAGKPSETRRSELSLEWSPPDYENAPHVYGAEAGLAARDLTYEIRYALRLAADAPGVVLCRVEPGGRAERAGISPGDLLLEAYGRTLRAAADLGAALAQARSEGAPAVTLLLCRDGATRLAEIPIKE